MQYTQQQILELVMCSEDPIYFIEKYVKIQHPVHGATPVKWHPYQKRYLRTVHSADSTPLIGAFGRQMGMTTMMCAYTLWESLFKSNTSTMIVGFSQVHVQEVLSRLYAMNDALPSWMQLKMLQRNKFGCQFENGSRITMQVASRNTGRGMSLNRLWIDEPAQVFRKTEAHEMLTSLVPCLHATGGSFILAGSGRETLALAKLFSYCNIFRADWRAVPDRDQAWANHMVEVMGEAQFKREYELD